jgi:hypothetical protein
MRIIIYFVVFTFNIVVATYTLTVAIKLSQVTESWVGIAIMVSTAVLNIISAVNMIDAIKEAIKNKG